MDLFRLVTLKCLILAVQYSNQVTVIPVYRQGHIVAISVFGLAFLVEVPLTQQTTLCAVILVGSYIVPN